METILVILEDVEENKSVCVIPAVLIQQLFTIFRLFLSGFEYMYTNTYVLLQSFYYTHMHTHFYVLLYPLGFFTLPHCLQIYHLK